MKKIISVVSALCILNLLLGCSQTRLLTVSDLKFQNKISEYVILHTPGRKYILDYYSFREQTLEGNLKKFKSQKGMHLHVYRKSGINYKLDEDALLSVSIDYSDINKIEYKRTILTRTVFMTAGIITGAVLISGIAGILTDQPIWLYNFGEN